MTFEESDETKAEKKAMKRLQKQLPLELRKQIYYETYEAANKAYADLEREYPTESAPPKGEKEFRDWGIRQLEYRKQQDIKHKAEVAKKHGLTHTELEGVKYEGDLAQWPYPE